MILSKRFCQEVIEAWKTNDIAQFDALYSIHVNGMINQETKLNYADIKNRFLYIGVHNIDRQFEIKDMLIEENKAALFFCYTAYDTRLQQPINAPTLWILTIDQEKICHVEILTSLKFNYHHKI